MNQQNLDQLVDQQADIKGVARDAHAGAVVVMDDRTPVYIEGLQSWDDDVHGKRVHVTGVLRRKSLAPEPKVDADGAVSHGISGANFVVEKASWTVEAP